MSNHVLRGKGKPFPYNETSLDAPDMAVAQRFICPRVSCKRPPPFPPPAGEGVAHKGDRRGRTWRDRDVKMTATVAVCE